MIKIRVLKTETKEVYKNGVYGAKYYDSDKLTVTHNFNHLNETYTPLELKTNIYNKDVFFL
tara:strand:- start:13185 stop:13367 length:183 start_codon:yes stop_codon:yes gene_type:complete